MFKLAIAMACGLVIITCGAVASGAHAAVRICGSPIMVTASDAGERQAKKAALDAWKVAAAKLGEGYTGWRIAAGRVLTCKKTADGGYTCVARGTPCTIDQAPDKRELRSKRLDT